MLIWEDLMMNRFLSGIAAVATVVSLSAFSTPALADITIGVTIPTTGPGAALGIPLKNSIELWPEEIGGKMAGGILAPIITGCPRRGYMNAVAARWQALTPSG